MIENTFHAAALAMFVALCIAAASAGVQDNATTIAACRGALITAQLAAQARPATRIAQLQAPAEAAQRPAP